MREIWKRIYKYRYFIIFFFFIGFAYFANTFHESFPDEFDNIVGGWYITRGILPYVGFFTHHNPGAYFISALIVLFTHRSFVSFRIVWSLVLLTCSFFSYFFLKRKFGFEPTKFFLLYLFLLAVGSVYFWGQMMLSETVVGYALVPVYVLLLLSCFYNKKLSTKDIVIVSVCTSLALLTSLTFLFSVILLIAISIALYVFSTKQKLKSLLISIAVFSLPYLIFGSYLFVTKSVERFYFSSYYYNREYYIYNFPLVAGQVSKNPVRYIYSIFYNTTVQFYNLGLLVKDFNFAYPVNVSLFLGNAALIIYLISKRKLSWAGILYLFLIYLNARSEPLTSKETDFHSTVYIMISLVNISWVLLLLIKELSSKSVKEIEKYLYLGLLGLLGIYTFYLGSNWSIRFFDKVYAKSMGQMPAIYDNPVAAPIINKLVSKDEYFWIGPFEFQELLYINGKLASKYQWFLPASARSPRIREELISDLTKNRPKVIVFKDYLTYFGTAPKDYNYPIVDFLKAHYFRLKDLEAEGIRYKLNYVNLHNFDVYTDFYFDNTRKDEILNQMLNTHIIEKI